MRCREVHRGGQATATKARTVLAAVAGVAAGLALAACQSIPSNEGKPLEFKAAERPPAARAFPNWPRPPEKLETELPKALDAGEFEFEGGQRTEKGIGGAQSVDLYFPAIEETVRVKWKELPRDTLEEVNNEARKALAAYELQKLFLDPEDYVVPTSVIHCAPLKAYRKDIGWRVPPSLPGSDCMMGAVSIWLKDVTVDDALYDEARFVSDPTYAYYMSNFNILTYLVDHRDAKQGNFLIAKDEARRQVFSIDHDIAFQPFLYNYFMGQWDYIFVPALRKESVERLRRLKREDLDTLGVVAQLEKNERRIFVSVPPGENLAPNEGVRIQGDTVQFGLARFEIDGVWQRIQKLLAEVDEGRIAVFEG